MRADGLTGAAAAALAALVAFVSLVPYPYISTAQLHGVPFLRLVPLAAGAALAALLLADYFRSRSLPGPVYIALPLLFLVLAQLAGAAGSVNPSGSMVKVCFYALTGVVLYFASARFVRGREPVILWSLLAASAVAGLFCVAEFLTGRTPLYFAQYSANNPYIFYEQLKGRSFGTLGHPVFTGALFVLAVPAGFYLIDSARSLSVRIAAAASMVAALAGLMFTFTRSAYFAVAVSALVYYRDRLGVRAVAVVLVAALAVGGIVAGSGKVRDVFSRRDPVTEYIQNRDKAHRVRAFEIAARVMADVPLLGMGVGNYRDMYDNYRTGGTDTRATYATPDNMYLISLMETGLLGLGLLLYVMWSAFAGLNAAEAKADAGDVRLMRYGASLLAGFAVCMFFFDALYVEPVRVIFWSLLGMAASKA